ncbi:MAG: dephospho-CoA kinase [Candidatus Limnocylindrales bacterium]
MSATPPRGRRRAVRIGITGPIGCGKSTIAGWLGERPGVVVIDADEVAREVLGRGEPAVTQVIDRFGQGVLRSDGSIDRGALGRLVFADPDALRDLEGIVHPAVRPRILAAIDASEADEAVAVVIEAIKLVEGGLVALCDEVWLVTCEPEAQRARLVGRGSAVPDAEQRIAAQGDMVARLRTFVTRVIDTSVDQDSTRRAAELAFAEAIDRVDRDR